MCAVAFLTAKLWRWQNCVGRGAAPGPLWSLAGTGELLPAFVQATLDRLLPSWRNPELSDALPDRRMEIFALQTSSSAHQQSGSQSFMSTSRLEDNL